MDSSIFDVSQGREGRPRSQAGFFFLPNSLGMRLGSQDKNTHSRLDLLLFYRQAESDSISQAFSRVLSSLLIYCRAQLHDATGNGTRGAKWLPFSSLLHFPLSVSCTDGNSDLFAQAAANDLLPLVQ